MHTTGVQASAMPQGVMKNKHRKPVSTESVPSTYNSVMLPKESQRIVKDMKQSLPQFHWTLFYTIKFGSSSQASSVLSIGTMCVCVHVCVVCVEGRCFQQPYELTLTAEGTIAFSRWHLAQKRKLPSP